MIKDLCLTVSLRVERDTILQLSTSKAKIFFAKCAKKDTITIWNNRIRESMQFDHLIKKFIGYIKNLLATSKADNICLNPRKWPYVLKWSMTTKIAVKLWEIGNPSTKSIDIFSHMRVGIGKSWRRPAGDKVEYLCV